MQRTEPRPAVRRALAALLLAPALALACATPEPAPRARPRPRAAPVFRVEVVDAQTGRGIPAVELHASNERTWVTDSAGVAAVLDPGLMEQDVFFRVRSFGYTFEGKEQGVAGARLRVRPGRSARLAMRRDNVAERLYRVTGVGRYRDSLLVGDTPPFRPKPQGQLPTGADSVLTVSHRGRLFWVWGDTRQLTLPYGIFRSTAATSLPSDRPGVDPERGIDLRYFGGRTGLRPMIDDPHPVIWLSALRSVPDASGKAKLFATYRKIEAPLDTVEQGLAEYDDAGRRFRLVAAYPPDAPMVPDGHAFRYREDGVAYVQYDWGVRGRDHADGPHGAPVGRRLAGRQGPEHVEDGRERDGQVGVQRPPDLRRGPRKIHDHARAAHNDAGADRERPGARAAVVENVLEGVAPVGEAPDDVLHQGGGMV
ncbi:MAG: hypothetical protein ABFS41_12565, partial [Myxococcota bacterium]